ncbi:hypothetical protein IQ268_02100 [Oculatella sp. LEGE 06141]|uniref:hypothetical protein n=1 Tax=Oculatella sp. LEGE 06141 TaxID=1828648 RepID=UPI00187E5256|nr:hypothetical protein [Oculatella sp. LEGE 06141]MBE9177366.1 hypothetical protein [Oculatella sp. LEGE 06141]
MLLFRKYTVCVSVVTVLSILATSCSESKVSQCNQLIEIANGVVTDVQTVTQTAKGPQDTQAMEKIANTTAQARSEMESLQFADERLQAYQTRFISMYSDTSQATNAMVTAVSSQDAEAAQQAFDALQDATERESPLVEEVNTYCNN